MPDIIVFRFLFPIFIVIFLSIPTVYGATDARSVDQLAAREAARKAAVTNDPTVIEQTALDTITGCGKPIQSHGVALFDPNTDVNINFYDGDHVDVTVTYRHYLLSPNFMTLIGGKPIGPMLTFNETATFEREW